MTSLPQPVTHAGPVATRLPGWALPVLVALCGLVWVACGPSPGETSSGETSPTAGTSRPTEAGRAEPALGEGVVVWESNRTGDWRLWTRRLETTTPRQLTTDEAGMQHCCPHLSPDGESLVYLRRRAPRDEYPEEGVSGELRRLHLESGEHRVVAPAARTYGRGNRVAVWRDDGELIYIDGEGRTRLLDLATGESRTLTAEPREELGWLMDATLAHATSGRATFSLYDAETRRIAERRDLGGCEPYFSHDGRWGFWVPGAGGPIDRIDLSSREVSTILDKNDPRLEEKGYLYFPMLSRDGRLLAFGASADDHSHFEADYDIFVAPTDPDTLEITGRPVRITTDPATDRYPDVFLARAATPVRRAESGRDEPGATDEAPAASDDGEPTEEGWPVRSESLVFLWQTGNSPNLVDDPETGHQRTYGVEAEGRARLDHHHRMVLDRGAFVASPEAARHLLDRAVTTNELTIEATLNPARESFEPAAAMRRIVTFSDGMRGRNFTVGQEGSFLVARLQTGLTGPNADRPQVKLFELEPGQTTHLALTYSPGRLVAYRDGEAVLESDAITGSFTFHWKPRTLLFGREAGGGGDWHGTLEGIALYARELPADTIRESATRYRELEEERPAVPRWRVRGQLGETSRVPTLRQISPYRRALAVYEYRLLEEPELVEGKIEAWPEPRSETIRVARWVLLDGTAQPEASLSPGKSETLVVEPLDANPQLGDVYLSDTLPPAEGSPLFYSVEP